MKWCSSAADSGLAEAQKDLAVTYMDGQVVDQDPLQAARWMEEAAKQLDLPAAHGMGEMYRDGTALGVDKSKARFWFQRSANAGYRASIRELRRLNSQWVRRLFRKRLLQQHQQQQQQRQRRSAKSLVMAI